MSLRDYEDYLLLAAAIAAAISEALQPLEKYAIWAIILGALAKALFSIVDNRLGRRGGSGS